MLLNPEIYRWPLIISTHTIMCAESNFFLTHKKMSVKEHTGCKKYYMGDNDDKSVGTVLWKARLASNQLNGPRTFLPQASIVSPKWFRRHNSHATALDSLTRLAQGSDLGASDDRVIVVHQDSNGDLPSVQVHNSPAQVHVGKRKQTQVQRGGRWQDEVEKTGEGRLDTMRQWAATGAESTPPKK